MFKGTRMQCCRGLLSDVAYTGITYVLGYDRSTLAFPFVFIDFGPAKETVEILQILVIMSYVRFLPYPVQYTLITLNRRRSFEFRNTTKSCLVVTLVVYFFHALQSRMMQLSCISGFPATVCVCVCVYYRSFRLLRK